jgi:hypothetical protein
MSEAAAAYQTRAGGLPPGMGYYVNRPGNSVPVQFDGYQGGELIDAKYYLENGYFVRGGNAFRIIRVSLHAGSLPEMSRDSTPAVYPERSPEQTSQSHGDVGFFAVMILVCANRAFVFSTNSALFRAASIVRRTIASNTGSRAVLGIPMPHYALFLVRQL